MVKVVYHILMSYNITEDRANPIAFRPPTKIREFIEHIAQDEGRSMANVVVNIVTQYLTDTNGKLLRHPKIVEKVEEITR